MGAQGNTSKAEQWFNKGYAAHHAGKLEEAEELYRKVLNKLPSHAETLYLLGTALSQLKRFDEAEKCLRKSLKINPDHPEALNNLGLTLKDQGNASDAIPFYRRALELKPDYADALSNLGGALEHIGELDEAEIQLRQSLQLNPNLPDSHYILGLVLRGKDKFEEASRCFMRGLELKPDHASAYCDLGVIYKMWGRYDEALSCFQRALVLNPGFYVAQLDIGATLEETGHLDEAHAAYERAIELNPNEITAKWNMALLYLKQGKLDPGWEAYDLRFRVWQAYRRFSYPEWDGSSLAGKRILIYAEQGVGDEIYFASCFPDMIASAEHCVIECDPRLAPLYTRTFPSATIIGSPRSKTEWQSTQAIDLQVAEGSLPRFLRPTLESFPASPGYLVADSVRVEYWRARISKLGAGLKVGICWRSGLTKGERHKEYSQLTQWGNILKTQGVFFVNLQYGECADELKAAEEKFGVNIFIPELNLKDELDESAALIQSLDLVIAPGTATEATAGSLGVETWLISGHQKPWAALGTEGIPGMPNTRIFCQPSAGDWDTLLALIGEALSEKTLERARRVENVPVSFDCKIAVTGSLDDLSTFVLKEQGGWFDQEYEFMLRIAPGMNMVDAGSGVGAYAVPMARAGAKLWAYTQTALETDLLMKSRSNNCLEKHISVAIVDDMFSLDAEMDRCGLDNISIVRISTELAGPDLLRAGEQFFSLNSPLVMFGVDAIRESGIAEAFASKGYGLYRFVPGLNLLVPFVSKGELDAFSLNLFACKADRAQTLERQGMLIRQFQPLDSFPGADLPCWQEYLGATAYSSRLVDGWRSAPGQKDWEVYWMALNLFAMSKSAEFDPAKRHACLQTAAATMNSLVQESASIPRLLSLTRMLIDLGMREAAVHLLNHVCAHLGTGILIDEPFLALSEEFEKTGPKDRMTEWITAMILEERERLRAFSSYFTGQESLPVLKEIRATGFLSNNMSKRIELIEERFGAQG